MVSNHLWAQFVIAVAAIISLEANGRAEDWTVSTGDELRLSFSSPGALNGLSVGGQDLLPSDRRGDSPLSVCDIVRGVRFVPVTSEKVEREGDKIVQQAEVADLGLAVTARYAATKELINVHLSVRDTSGADRGLLIRFALPIQAEGWRWWDDLDRARPMGTSGTFENSRGIREFAALPEWRDKPELSVGKSAVNFCNAVTGPVGLCYAVPLDQPRIFRVGYDAASRSFYIVYDVALAKETQPPGEAEFTFHVYRCDPQWGLRSALDRYYRLFPQFFTKHVRRQGQWMAFSSLSEIDNVNEFRFAYQEGAPEPGYDDRLGVDSLTYFTHAGMFANIPDYNPETDPEPSYERQLAAMRAQFARQTGKAEIFDASALFDVKDRLAIARTAVYGHIIAQYNLDPDLPYGQYMLGTIDRVFQDFRQRRGGELDGFYYDGITTGINYRREHFRYAGYPPIWDPVAKKPLLYNYFSSVEFAKATAERLHAEGKITMMNGALGSSYYTAPYLDVMGAETGLRIDRASFNYVRTICWQKPFVTLLKGNFSQLTADDFAGFMKRCVAFGVFPGFFDWPPSGLGPGSRYWDHADWYERDRLNHRKYQALCQQLAEAGWQPLTLARSSDAALVVERFGTAAAGEVFFTVLNDEPVPVDALLSIPVSALPPDSVVVEEVGSRPLAKAAVKGESLEVPVHLEPESLAVLHAAPRQQLLRSHTRQIARSVDFRQQMAELDRDRPERLVHWPPARHGGYAPDRVEGAAVMKLANDSDDGIRGATQWVMLYQQTPEPLKLRLRLRSDSAAPVRAGGVRIDAVLCHVNMKTQFTERKTESYELKSISHGWQSEEIVIQPSRPLRSIQLSLYLWKCAGTVWIDEVSLTSVSQPDHEYVVDPGMDQWYEQPSSAQWAEVDSRFSAVRQGLAGIESADPAAVLDACLSVLKTASQLKQWIQDNKLDNPCRRAVREIDDLTSRLSLASTTLMGVSGPHLDVPATAVPGEEVTVRAGIEGVPQAKVAYTLSPPDGWPVAPAGDGAFRVSIPENALGTTGKLVATATIESSPGMSLPLLASAQVRIVPAIEAALRLRDLSPSGGEFHFSLDVSNHASSPTEVAIRAQLPPGWQQQNPLETRAIGAKSQQQITFCVTPGPNSQPGNANVAVELTSPRLPAPLKFTHVVRFLPASLNRLRNPGFESGDANWSKNETGYQIDDAQAHSGRHSLRLRNATVQDRGSASQTITLNQTVPRPIVVRGHAKAENVSGHSNRTFAVYVDIYYTDGTPLYGRTIDWQTGTTDWQYGEIVIEPAKPIRNVNVYLLLRGHSGTAWFDDLFVSEQP